MFYYEYILSLEDICKLSLHALFKIKKLNSDILGLVDIKCIMQRHTKEMPATTIIVVLHPVTYSLEKF